MANFAPVNVQMSSMNRAAGLLPQLQTIYEQSQFAQAAITDYQAATDPVFNQTVNSIFTPAERSELAQMFTQLNNLVTNWTANHSALLATQI